MTRTIALEEHGHPRIETQGMLRASAKDLQRQRNRNIEPGARRPLRIVCEITEWTRLTPEQLQTGRERVTVLLEERMRRNPQLRCAQDD